MLASFITLGLGFAACNNTNNKTSEIDNKTSDMEHHQHHKSETMVSLTTEPNAVEAGSPVNLKFVFNENGHPVPLDISHEKKVHLMIVDESLSWFRHIHPIEQPDASYTVSETFPTGGKYFLFTDFKPKGATSMVDRKELNVSGNADQSQTDFSNKFVSVVDDYTVTLENGNSLKTNRTQALEISVVKDGKRLSESDIEPYLAATAHIAMISKESKDFLHIHPVTNKNFPIYAEKMSH